MTDRFVALPVGQGDAFFIQRGAFTALIDGGRSRLALPTMFKEKLKRDSVDVLVCTHNDADHAVGVLGFLESGLSCSEVWLPAMWRDRLDDLLTKPEAFLDELIRNVRELPQEHIESDERVRLDRLGDRFTDEYFKAYDEQKNTEEKGQPVESATLHMENDNGNTAPDWPRGLPHYRLMGPYPLWSLELNGDPQRWQLLHQALSAASRIRDIAIACAHRGVPIRWFRHSLHQPRGGKSRLLVPINAFEVARIILRRIPAFRWLALSTANRLSLTFCSPPENDYPGVVFTADSDLKSSAPIPWCPNMIVTAPHHGSEANKAAYARFHRDIEGEFDVIWVRSDGNFKSRPGSSYLSERRRFCTLCRAASRQKQDLSFEVKNGWWAPKSPPCACHDSGMHATAQQRDAIIKSGS